AMDRGHRPNYTCPGPGVRLLHSQIAQRPSSNDARGKKRYLRILEWAGNGSDSHPATKGDESGGNQVSIHKCRDSRLERPAAVSAGRSQAGGGADLRSNSGVAGGPFPWVKPATRTRGTWTHDPLALEGIRGPDRRLYRPSLSLLRRMRRPFCTVA